MNNQLVPETSTLLRNKLAKLAIRLQQQAAPDGSGTYATLEQVVIEAYKILSEFYKQLSEPGYIVKEVVPDMTPLVEDYNNTFTAILDDLQVIFSEFENLEGVVVGNFNYLVSRLNRLQRRLKVVSSLLGDYALFSDLATKDAIFVSDSFNNLYRVEANSPLLNATQCEINQVEGIVTLPANSQNQSKVNITILPVINSNSNGQIGNNWELNSTPHASIADILDSNADTWFEYERVLVVDDGAPLILDLTLNLGDPRVINCIRINPNNFGARTEIKIDAIDTSVDGQAFISVKDDIPIAGFVVQDEENVFTLAPASSKYAGQGLFTFTPRLAKYVHIALRQTTSHTITDWNGKEKYRYAIGIRDIEVQAIPYETSGEIVSTNYEFLDEVRKVVLLSNQRPDAGTTSVLCSIEHFISPDNGITWYPIRPRSSAGVANATQQTSELLDFNGVEANSIITINPIKSLRYKAVFKRNTEAFKSTSSEMAQEVANKTELHSPPLTTPFNLKLQEKPIDNSLQLLEAPLGTRGDPKNPYYVGYGTGEALRFYLPFLGLERVATKVLNPDGTYTTIWGLPDMEVYVEGKAWTRGTLTGDNERYTFDPDSCLLSFGDGTNGAKVPAGGEVKVVLGKQLLSPSRGPGHKARVSLPMVRDKKRIAVMNYGAETMGSLTLQKGQTRHLLKSDSRSIWTDVTIASSTDITVVDPAKPATFIDGVTEFTGESDGHWSISEETGHEDLSRGVQPTYLYTKVSTPSDTPVTITFRYTPTKILADEDWDFTDVSEGRDNGISIREGAFATTEVEQDLSLCVSGNYVSLAYPMVMRGTLVFPTGTTAFAREVEFIDGEKELSGAVRVAEQISALPASVAATHYFRAKIVSSTNYTVVFSNTDIFKNEVFSAGEVDDLVGNYYIDRAYSPTGRVIVNVDSAIDDPGSVEYFYANDQISRVGMYSVNYDSGEIFTVSAIDAGVVVTYEIARYQISHDIGRKVPEDDWKYDSTTNSITIEDREILRAQRTPRGAESGRTASRYYQTSYRYVKTSRAEISKLEPYFSPVLKDYALKVITKSRLI